jgi:hypothetical protein
MKIWFYVLMAQRVNGAKTTRLEHGDCAVAWNRLTNKFAPKTAPSRLILQNLFQSCDKQDPNKWLMELEDLQERLAAAKSDMTDEAFLEHALNLNIVPQEYNIEVLLLES